MNKTNKFKLKLFLKRRWKNIVDFWPYLKQSFALNAIFQMLEDFDAEYCSIVSPEGMKYLENGGGDYK